MNVCSRRVDLSSINISVFLSLNRTNCYDDKRNWSYHYLPSTGKKEYKNSGYSATNRENRLVFPMLFSRHCRQNISSWLFLRNLPTDFPRFNLIYSKTQMIFFSFCSPPYPFLMPIPSMFWQSIRVCCITIS